MAAARRLFASPPSRGAVSVFLRSLVVIAFMVMFVFYAIPRQKAFTVSAVTESVKVHAITDGGSEWSIYDLELCIPKPPDGTAPAVAAPNQPCSASFYNYSRFDIEQTVRWTDDYVLDIQAFDNDRLLIYVERLNVPEERQQPVTIDNQTIEDGSILYIPMDGPDRPILPLRGYVTLGESPVLSEANVLLEGTYEIRQSFRPRREIYLVTSGTFAPGDRVSFVRNARPFWADARKERLDERDDGRMPARIFVSNLDTGSKGFNIVATTDLAFSDILLARVGGAPTEIPATAAQRLAADPFPVATATALGLLATLLALINTFLAKPGPSGNRRE